MRIGDATWSPAFRPSHLHDGWETAVAPHRTRAESAQRLLLSYEEAREQESARTTELEANRDLVPNYSYSRDDRAGRDLKFGGLLAATVGLMGLVGGAIMAPKSFSLLQRAGTGVLVGAATAGIAAAWVLAQADSSQLTEEALLRDDAYADAAARRAEAWEAIGDHGEYQRLQALAKRWEEVDAEPTLERLASRANQQLERYEAADADRNGWIDVDPYSDEVEALGGDIRWLRSADVDGDRRATAGEIRTAIAKDEIDQQLQRLNRGLR